MTSLRVRFPAHSPFYQDLKHAVDAYFERTGRSPYGGWRMPLKTAILFTWLIGSYVLLLLSESPWQAALLAVSLGMAMAGIGFDVMHDANHGSYSPSRVWNRTLGASLDFLGASSFMWKQKHNVLHHTYTNVSGIDTDLEGNALLRFAPSQPRRPWQRFQHWYVWFIFAIYPFGWWFFDDFNRAARGRIGESAITRPRGFELAGFFTGKAIFFTWAFVLPALIRPTWAIVPLTFLAVATLGITLAVVFQLAHCVGEAEFFESSAPQAIGPDWAVHQVSSTVDFARHNRLLSWYLGGLNFQVEHHLFPKVSHVHYAALAPIVEGTCRAHGITYRAYPSFRAAFAAHVRWMRRLGQPVAA